MTVQTLEPRLLPEHSGFHTSTVRWVRHWNEHLFSFAIERPASLRFRSGEFVMVGLDNGPRPLMRAYSIASPDYAEELEFLSIKVPDGPLTSRLQTIRAGDQVYLSRKPTGTLVCDALLPGSRLFLFSTGTGWRPSSAWCAIRRSMTVSRRSCWCTPCAGSAIWPIMTS
jgi:ferredoxin--NADP+ reductase